MGTGKLLGKPNKLRGSDLRWTIIPSRANRNTLSRFMLKKPGYAPAAMSQSGPKASLLSVFSRLYTIIKIFAFLSLINRCFFFFLGVGFIDLTRYRANTIMDNFCRLPQTSLLNFS